MSETISKYIKDCIDIGYVKALPYSKDIEELGFYMVIHPSARIEDSEQIYQCTLFLKDKPSQGYYKSH